MINRLIATLPSPAPGAAQPRQNKQIGVRDFGALLDGQPAVEVVESRPGGWHLRDQSGQLPIKELGPPVAATPTGGDVPMPIPVLGGTGSPDAQPPVLPLPMVPVPAIPPQGSPVGAVGMPPAAPSPAGPMPINGASLSRTAGAEPSLYALADPIVEPTRAAVAFAPETPLPMAAPEAGRIVVGAMGERIDLVSMPWRLQANAGLSYRTVHSDARGVAAGAIEETPVVCGTSVSVHGQLFTFASLAEAASIADWLDSLQPLAGGFDRDRSAADGIQTAEATDFTPAETLASLVWPERLLRWLADADGKGTTAWVRDYQLSALQAAQMIDALRSLGDQQGLQLRRIMFNGQELWRSAPNPESTSRG